jgi:hypothetical protein
MLQAIKSCCFIVLTLWGVILADQWLAMNAPFGIFGRSGLLLGVAVAGTVLLRRFTRGESARLSPANQPNELSSEQPRASEQVLRELALAMEHLESIRVLLEISDSHQQPVPRAVPTNLRLVLKHLRSAGRQLDVETQSNVRAFGSAASEGDALVSVATHTTRAF